MGGSRTRLPLAQPIPRPERTPRRRAIKGAAKCLSTTPIMPTTAGSFGYGEREVSMCGRFTLTKPQALPAAFPQFPLPGVQRDAASAL